MKGMVKDSFYGIDQLKKDYGLKTDDVWLQLLTLHQVEI